MAPGPCSLDSATVAQLQQRNMSRVLLGCLRAATRRRWCARERFSSSAVLQPEVPLPEDGTEYIDFPGGRVPLTSSLDFNGVSQATVRTSTYRTIDLVGNDVPGAQVPFPLDKATAVRIYTNMAALQVG